MLKFALHCATLTMGSIIFFVLGFLIQASWPFLNSERFPFFLTNEWFPYENLFGFLPIIVGSFWSVILALVIAIPLAVSSAIFISEILPNRWRMSARFIIELLAGIPSVIYGLLGLWFLLPFLEKQLDLLTGRSLLAAGLLLSVMILPTIILMSEDAINHVVKSQREAAKNLGLGWSRRLQKVILFQALPGIRIATLLGLGRALGETIAVMLVVGSIDRLPDPWYNIIQPAQTLTSRIGREMSEAAVGSIHWAALMTCGLILAFIAMILASPNYFGKQKS